MGYSGALGRQIESELEAAEALVFDADDLYAQCKAIDGAPTADGTFIRVACTVLSTQGGLVKQVLPGLTPEQLRKAAADGAFPDDVLNLVHELINWIEDHFFPTPPPQPVPPTPVVNVGDRLKISAYARLANETELKQAIATYGDAWIGSPWYNSWFNPGADGVLPAADSIAGGHAYKLVGYDDAKGAFLMQNSWSAGWGLAGHAWMPYGFIDLGNPEWEGWRTF